ncbi:hypothetical protein PENDEC_c010G03569 [Penicillium decumbens]|uniref:Uncharacterized protein n=1 Tax=Penicillium decumbens TaxID=69771 RepID=A0A1V6PBY6_PENDC|nr:hypothetical protein PENDEC_c010G03569 [Penicillium decumbens]
MSSSKSHRMKVIRSSSSGPDNEANDDLQGQSRLLSPTRQKQTHKSWYSEWLWEFLGLVTSMVSLIAIIIVLWYYDGRPMPDWPYGITLNALLSILSTVMKATLVFAVSESLGQLKWPWFHNGKMLSDLTLLDSATRGLTGACLFLVKTLPR